MQVAGRRNSLAIDKKNMWLSTSQQQLSHKQVLEDLAIETIFVHQWVLNPEVKMWAAPELDAELHALLAQSMKYNMKKGSIKIYSYKNSNTVFSFFQDINIKCIMLLSSQISKEIWKYSIAINRTHFPIYQKQWTWIYAEMRMKLWKWRPPYKFLSGTQFALLLK